MTVTIECVSVPLSLGQPPFAYLPVCLLANEPWRGFREHTSTAPMQIPCVGNTRSFKAQSRLSLPTFLLWNRDCDPDRAPVPGHRAVCGPIVLKHGFFFAYQGDLFPPFAFSSWFLGMSEQHYLCYCTWCETIYPFLRWAVFDEGQFLLPVWLELSFVKGISSIVLMKGNELVLCIRKNTWILWVCERNAITRSEISSGALFSVTILRHLMPSRAHNFPIQFWFISDIGLDKGRVSLRLKLLS